MNNGLNRWENEGGMVPDNNETILQFQFSEDTALKEIYEHIADTYHGHYSHGIQTTEFIMSHASSMDYLKGNAIKYICRYGLKEGHNRKDLLKAIHYVILMMHFSQKI